MRYFNLILILILLSCSSPVPEPKNLIPKDTMAELIADLAINDQMGILNQQGNMETNTIYILKKHKVNSKQFTESYNYYIANPGTLEDIYNDAQDIIKDKDPEAADFIKKKQKATPGQPALER